MVDQEAYDTLVKAQGVALSLLVTMLGRANALDAREFGVNLGVLASATAVEAPDEGLILGAWAAMIEDIGQCVWRDEAPSRHN